MIDDRFYHYHRLLGMDGRLVEEKGDLGARVRVW